MRLAELVSILRDALLRKTPQDENNRTGESSDPTDGELIEQRRLINLPRTHHRSKSPPTRGK
jgi:hypothetical protein